MDDKVKSLLVAPDTSLKEALAHMDKIGYKLLIFIDDQQKFKGLLSIGDIQRAIIANYSLDEPALNFVREGLITARPDMTEAMIKAEMLKHRLVYMPVINADNKIERVIFWEDILQEESHLFPKLGLPVVIMAGGFGTRLKPLTNVLPKPLLPYGDKTILESIIDRFKKFGCVNFDISVNYKADFIQFYFDRIKDKDYNVNLFSEDAPLGTAGSLRLLKDKLKTTFFVSNCDILIEEDYSAIYNFHKEHNHELTLVASLKNYRIPYGTIESGNNGELIDIKEKPELSFMINCGLYILEPHLLSEIPENTFFHITHLMEKIKGRGGKVGVFPISEKSWIDIGEWQFYSKILLQ